MAKRGGKIPKKKTATIKDKPKSYGLMTVPLLKDELRKRGIRVGGNKDVLVQRLLDYDRNNNFLDADDTKENAASEATRLPFPWPEDGDYDRSVSISSKVPNLNSVTINMYFIKQYSLGVGLSEFEAVNPHGYAMAREYFLASLREKIDEGNSLFFYHGQVNSEMTKALTYFVKLCVRLYGSIVQSECECAAGKGPLAVCKHVAAICYVLEYFRDHGKWLIRPTVTQRKQKWHAPKTSRVNVSPKKAEDLKLAIQKPGQDDREKSGLCYDPRRPTATPVDYNARARSAIINFTNFSHANLGISTIFPVASTTAVVNDHQYLDVPLAKQQVLNRIKVIESQARSIEKKSQN